MSTTVFEWENIVVRASHVPCYLNGPFDHIEIRAAQPLPFTETGYKSHFIHPDELAHFEDAFDFVLQWLDQSVTDEWLEDQKQQSLF